MNKQLYKFENNDGEVKKRPNDERWNWGVVYENDEELHQFGNDGWFHSIREVEQDRVKLFSMYKPDDMNERIDLQVADGMQIFHFLRHTHAHYFEDMNDTAKVYVFGFKKDGVASYNFILPDDRIIVSHNDVVNLPEYGLKQPE